MIAVTPDHRALDRFLGDVLFQALPPLIYTTYWLWSAMEDRPFRFRWGALNGWYVGSVIGTALGWVI